MEILSPRLQFTLNYLGESLHPQAIFLNYQILEMIGEQNGNELEQENSE